MAAKRTTYKLLKYGDPFLTKVCQPVVFPLSDEVDKIIDDCQNTLRHVEGFWHKRSISCAAPQVGSDLRLFVMCDRVYWYHPKLMYKKFMSIFNPQIIDTSLETCEAWEGCISNSDEIALVRRPKQVKVRFNNIKGQEVDMICDGLISRIFQHETDHLNGKAMEEQAFRFFKIKEIENPEAFDKFSEENKKFIIEY